MQATENKFMLYAKISTVIYVMGELLDMATTYTLSPDLAFETNLMVRRYGFGWTYMVVSAIVVSIIIWFVQSWIWRRLSASLPDDQMTYKSLYSELIFNQSVQSPGASFKDYAPGVLMGILFVVTYAVIASKLITVVWNFLLITDSAGTYPQIVVTIVKNILATSFGILMFYVFPYFLYRRHISHG